MRIVILAVLAVALPLAAQDTVRIKWSKSFPGSVPPWAEIEIAPDGAGLYREDPKEEDPVKFQLSDSERTQITDLTQKLDNFNRNLESGLKLAFMGAKTLRYEGPAGIHEAKFNYSDDPDAKALNDFFEHALETERAFIVLERSVKFDKLGAQAAILRVETLRDRNQLVAPRQFLPYLDRVAKNESFLNIARVRAAALADSIRKMP